MRFFSFHLMRNFDPVHPSDPEVLIPYLKANQATSRLGERPSATVAAVRTFLEAVG